jgi:cholesterol oxidase
VVDDRCEVHGNEGLFCMDSSAIPTSLGVNPSLTISAVCERAAEQLVLRAADYNLPAPAMNHRFGTPAQIVGPTVPSGAAPQPAPISSAGAAAPPKRRKRRKKRRHKKRGGRSLVR